MNLIEMFNALQLPEPEAANGIRFSAYSIVAQGKYKLGKDANGNPAILISIAHASGGTRPPTIVLENLTVQHNVSCLISQQDGVVEEGPFTILHCTGDDRTLHKYFLHILSATIPLLSPLPTQAQVDRMIKHLVELFRAMGETPRKSVQGLWAELFIVARSHNPETLIKAWHTEPNDCYDFNAGEQRLEVKSVTGRHRTHYFTLEQLHPPKGTQVLIASLFVERAGAGRSVSTLMEQIQKKIKNDLEAVSLMDQIVSITLGNNWKHALKERFDHELAESSLEFFSTSVIPSVDPNLPAGVSHVRFKSDLSSSSTISRSQYRALGGLFQAALRR